MSAALFYAFVAAVGFSALDALRKRLSTRLPPAALVAVVALAASVIFGVWALYEGRFVDSSAYFVPGLAVTVLHGAADLLFVLSVRAGDLGKTVPFLAFSPVFASLLGLVLLDEPLDAAQWAGVGAVVMGGFLLSLPPKGEDARGLVVPQLLMLAVGACWAGTAVFDKLALAHASPGAHGMLTHAGVGFGALALLGLRGEFSALRGARRSLASAVLLAPVGALALGAQFLALGGLEAGLVEAVKRAVGTTLAFVVGALFFRERFGPRHLLPLALLVAGTFLVR